MASEIRRLKTSDAEIYLRHRREALVDSPLAFAASPEDDQASSIEAVRQSLARSPDSVVFGAFAGELIGSIGIYRDHHRKAAHKAHVWGMYMSPPYRGRGIGRQLAMAALSHACELPGVSQVHLSVSDSAAVARRLYESRGFRVWGTEPDSLRHGGRSVSEHHMVLVLDEATFPC